MEKKHSEQQKERIKERLDFTLKKKLQCEANNERPMREVWGEREGNKGGYFLTISNLHADACLLSTQITLQAVYHEI